jgi:hypothetical protein
MRFWDARLREISRLDGQGLIQPDYLKALYPNILLCTESRGFFLMELIGSAAEFRGLADRYHKEPSINRYFGQFDLDEANPAEIFPRGENTYLRNFAWMRLEAKEHLERRFPHAASLFSTWIASTVEGSGSLLRFDPGANFVVFDNCLLVNNYKSVVRIRHINLLIVVDKSTSHHRYTSYLNSQFGNEDVKGVRFCTREDQERRIVASDFASTFLFPGLRETTIGEFLRGHPYIITRTFCARSFIYEPFLEWQEGTGVAGEKAINPDLMIERQDGFFDIYDLKLPLLNRASITRSNRPRRRFIDSVSEGIAQLSHYYEYFSFEKNREHARARYGIEVKDPRLGLIVGTYENVERRHIDEAQRAYRDFELIDYDTMMSLYLNSEC